MAITRPVLITVKRREVSGHMGNRVQHAVHVQIGEFQFHLGNDWDMTAFGAATVSQQFEQACQDNGIQIELTKEFE